MAKKAKGIPVARLGFVLDDQTANPSDVLRACIVAYPDNRSKRIVQRRARLASRRGFFCSAGELGLIFQHPGIRYGSRRERVRRRFC